MIGQLLDVVRGVMAVPHLVCQNAELEAENTQLREQFAGVLEGVLIDVDELEAIVLELYVGPTQLHRARHGVPDRSGASARHPSEGAR